MDIFETKTQAFQFPNHTGLILRENNGADEEVLSTVSKSKELTNIPEYLSRVIVGTIDEPNRKFTPDQIMAWRISQKYYALLCARILSLGPIMKFKYTFPGAKAPTVMSQDLTEFLYQPENIISEWSDRAIPHGSATEREITLDSNKIIRYNFLNTLGEKYALTIAKEKISMATLPMLQRNLQWFNGQEYIVVSDFSIFTSREMSQIRSDINSNDIDFYPMVKIMEPGNANKVADELPLLMMDAFFYPEEIL